MSRCVIISGGELNKSDLKILDDDFIICADSGYKHAKKYKIRVNLIIGDFDSLTDVPDNIEKITLNPIKDDTDTQSALKEGIKRGFKEFLFLGSLGKEDIGTLFPNNDPKYKGISSRFYLKECKKYLEESNYKISNIDIFISLEEPVLKPYILEMKKVISEDLNVEIKDISIKAGTNEKMGYIGKKKACECISVVLLEEEK